MKIVVISDTHNQHKRLEIPEGDCIIHCGDFSNRPKDMESFVEWYSNLDFKYKILVAGNHDYALEVEDINHSFKLLCHQLNIIYLENSGIEIEGIKFWGSPFSNEFCNWAFMANDLELADVWDLIPKDTNILITHGPAYGTGDTVYQNNGLSELSVGSITLKNYIKELKHLKYHLVGHIHESYGVYENNFATSFTTINASSFNYYEKELNKPMIFNI